jgi:CRP-like cAMP-binding protein/Ca2+-binding EF-hand superfamily protein
MSLAIFCAKLHLVVDKVFLTLKIIGYIFLVADAAMYNETLQSSPIGSAPAPWRHAVIVVGTMLCVLPFLWPLTATSDAPLTAVTWVLVVLSTLANVGVMFYHWTSPAHPKFLMLPFRKFVLRVHIFSGTAELALGIAAMLTRIPELAILTACTALLLHIPSSLQQTSIVFGSRAIMRPAYLACVAIHLFCAVQLLRFPDSMFWLVATFLVFNVYVWVRVYYFTFMLTGIFGDAKYSAAVVAAGLTTLPLIVGPTTILMIGLAVLVHYVLYRSLLLERSAEAIKDFVRERPRDVAVNEEIRALWQADNAKEDDQAAALYFRALDRDGDGLLGMRELQGALASWHVPESLIRELLAGKADTAQVDFQLFRSAIWSLGKVREKARQHAEVEQAKTDWERAALVFRRIDLNGDGLVSRFELELLLVEWGLPRSDVEHWLRLADKSGAGHLTQDDFYHNFRPVWSFIYYVVVKARNAETTSVRDILFGRAADAQRTARIRDALQLQRLQGVDLFAGGSDAFFEDMTHAMSQVQYTQGKLLFSEGDIGDAFYYIQSGRVRLSAQGQILAELQPGTYFGEAALLADNARNATAEVIEDATFLTIARDTFHYLLEKHPQMQAHIRRVDQDRQHSQSSQALALHLLSRIPLFQGIPHLDALGKSAVRRSVGAGSTLLAQGSAGDSLLVIVRGVVRVERNGIELAELREGTLLGEGAVLTGQPRSASAIALENTVFLELPRHALLAHDTLRERLTGTREERARKERQQFVRQDRLRRLSVLAKIPDHRLDALADLLQLQVVNTNTLIFQQGEVGDQLFLVKRGVVRIERDGTTIATVGSGGCFGELALLSGGVRTASALADTVTELLVLHRNDYAALTL